MTATIIARSFRPQRTHDCLWFPTGQKFPNYAPGAAAPLFSVNDWVTYESHMNPAVCRGTSLMENCMIDRFFVPVEA